MVKFRRTIPEDATELNYQDKSKLQRDRTLLRLLGMVKPWRNWILASNICIILSSFLSVFSLMAILPVLIIIFPKTPEPAKHSSKNAINNIQHSTNKSLAAHELVLQGLENKDDAITADDTSMLAKIRQLPRHLSYKRKEFEEWVRIKALINPKHVIYWVCFVFALATLLKALLDYISELCINRVQTQFLNQLTRQIYRHCLTHDLAFYHANPVGRMLNRVYNDTLKLRSILQLLYGKKIRQPITLCYAMIMLFIVHAGLAAVILLSVPLLLIPALLISKKIRRISRGETGIDASVMEIMEEQLGGARLIKSFGAEQVELQRFDKANDDMYERRWHRGVLQALNDPVMDVLIGMGLVLVILFGIITVRGGWGIGGETYLFFILTLSRFYAPLKDLTGVNVELQRPLMSAEAIFRLLDTPPRMVDTPDAVSLPSPWRQIDIQNVWFRYGKKGVSPNVLRRINLTIRAGESMAILGHNGSGKTTLSNLLYRFYDPTSGQISIDGIDLRHIKMTDLRREFGNVGQHAMLFNLTIAENIAFGVTPDKIDHARVQWAAEQTGADLFIRELPGGYAHPVGRLGNELSGGQRQLITLARVYYHRFSLIVYDEPTTHLDFEAEQAVTRIMHQLKHEHTVILITHNLQHALSFDRVILMQAGEIVQDTTPHQIDYNLLRRLEQEEAAT